ncbi:hypothetical protein SERLADRAFT_406232 [Serpula lacrymans var. lacrymans S7.9]|uniref:Uncharacterized protein n=1 Tax=Serpula lacrymans var. lacrymans (strain S7.9) TaxID=578457 RepID=F8NKX2_SERL9|nr:uncharacterized protein SERLADRAFT_406232 [Serpula lacrymans var. lacrymans S7.9]EGO28841.1 hypothetical protein SERLADRAFT_406232 [Serpula lacrymans var. lacrymans S7.9]
MPGAGEPYWLEFKDVRADLGQWKILMSGSFIKDKPGLSVKRGSYSTGTLYMTCCNNPKGIRYLTEKTFLIIVIPGLKEPKVEELNKILKPFVNDMLNLYKGQSFCIPGHQDKKPTNSIINSEVSNLPASRKIEGLAGHSSQLFIK